jgi:hypothetical protein
MPTAENSAARAFLDAYRAAFETLDANAIADFFRGNSPLGQKGSADVEEGGADVDADRDLHARWPLQVDRRWRGGRHRPATTEDRQERRLNVCPPQVRFQRADRREHLLDRSGDDNRGSFVSAGQLSSGLLTAISEPRGVAHSGSLAAPPLLAVCRRLPATYCRRQASRGQGPVRVIAPCSREDLITLLSSGRGSAFGSGWHQGGCCSSWDAAVELRTRRGAAPGLPRTCRAPGRDAGLAPPGR